MTYIIRFEGSAWFCDEKSLPSLVVRALRDGGTITVERVGA